MKRFLQWALVGVLTFAGLASVLLSFTSAKETLWREHSEPRKFGATYMTLSNPYFVVLDETLEEAVEANGDILITRDPAQDQDKQNEQILRMIDEGVSAIFLQPVDWKRVKPALIACEEAGIPVISVDAYVFDQQYVVTTIASDNYDAGVLCAKDIMEKRRSARIVILDHQIMQSVKERVQGFIDTLGDNPNYEVVLRHQSGADIETGMEAMHEVLDMGIEFDTLFGGNDPVTLGGLAALQKRRQDEGKYIYGVDGSPDGKTMIKEGYMEGSSAQQPILLAKTAVETMYRYLDGETIEQEIIIPVRLVTRENLHEVDVDGWQ